jgi:hypothetical protein
VLILRSFDLFPNLKKGGILEWEINAFVRKNIEPAFQNRFLHSSHVSAPLLVNTLSSSPTISIATSQLKLFSSSELFTHYIPSTSISTSSSYTYCTHAQNDLTPPSPYLKQENTSLRPHPLPLLPRNNLASPTRRRTTSTPDPRIPNRVTACSQPVACGSARYQGVADPGIYLFVWPTWWKSSEGGQWCVARSRE